MNMKRILILLLGLFSVAYGQFSPTSAKTAFKWGVSIGTRDSTAYAANDSLVVVINRQGRLMYRSTDGYWKLLANAASSDYVPYTGAVDNVALGNFRLTARSLKTDSIYANSSAGMYLTTNTGTAVAHWGSGGSVEVDFKGFAGYDANRASSYTARSFTDKNYVDSSAALRVRYTDTAAMLAPFVQYSDTTGLYSQVVRTFGTQTVGGNKTFSNDIVVNSRTIGKGTNSGSSNTVFGESALSGTGTGASNTAIGNAVLINNTNGSFNTGLGSAALLSNTIGVNNTAIGVSSLTFNTSDSNTAVGSASLASNTTGKDNVAIGYRAGGPNGLGGAGNQTGNGNVYVGSWARNSGAANSNEIVIGSFTTGNGSNTVTIGNSSITNNYFTGNIRGGAFIRSGGTSSQFLKADGSVDGTSYATAASLSGYVDLTTNQTVGGTKTFTSTTASNKFINSGQSSFSVLTDGNLSMYASSTIGNVISGAGSTYDISIVNKNGQGVIEVPTGTRNVNLGGALNGTSLSMSGALSGASGIFSAGAYGSEGSAALSSNATIGPFLVGNTDLSNNATAGASAVRLLYGGGGFTVQTAPSTTIGASRTWTDRMNLSSTTLTSYVPISGTSLSMSGGANLATSSGNVLIGTTSNAEAAKFKVDGGYIFLKESGGADTYFRSAFDGTNAAIQVTSNAGIDFATNNIRRAQIASDGTFLINTTTTDGTNKLIVNGGVKGTDAFFSGSVNLTKDGSNSPAAGPYFLWQNAAITRQYFAQLNASNNIDWWYFNGSTTTVKQTLNNDGGMTLTGALGGTSATFSSSVTATKFIGGSATPSVSLGAVGQVGTGATISISGNDSGGIIDLTTGTGSLSSGAVCTVTFSSAYANTPAVVITGSAGSQVTYYVSANTTSFTVTVLGAYGASTLQRFNYVVIGK